MVHQGGAETPTSVSSLGSATMTSMATDADGSEVCLHQLTVAADPPLAGGALVASVPPESTMKVGLMTPWPSTDSSDPRVAHRTMATTEGRDAGVKSSGSQVGGP